MKNYALLVTLWICGFSNAFSAEGINRKMIITTQEWAPYHFKLPNGEVGGEATEVVKKVFDEMNIKYEITIYPWARAQAMVKEGEADAFFAASWNEERSSYAVLSKVFVPQKWYWFLNKDSNLDPNSREFQQSEPVAVLLGTNMQKYLRDHNYIISGTPGDMDALVKMLDAKRIKAVLVNDKVIEEYFDNNKIDAGKYKKILCRDMPLGMYFSKKFLHEHKWFLDKFNNVVTKHSLIK